MGSSSPPRFCLEMGVLEEGGFGTSAKGGAGWGLGSGGVSGGVLVLLGAGLTTAPCQELEGGSEGPHLRVRRRPGSSHGWLHPLDTETCPTPAAPGPGGGGGEEPSSRWCCKREPTAVSPFSSGEGQTSRAGGGGGIWDPGSLWGTGLESQLCHGPLGPGFWAE